MNDSASLPIARKVALSSGATLTVRPAEESDAAQCVDYLNRIGSESDFLTFGADEFGFSVDDERQFISKYRRSDNALFLLAEVGGAIAGVLTFQGGSRHRVRHTGEFGITVARQYWGLGVGRELLKGLIEWAEANPVVHKLNLRVRVDNERAIRLYTSLGFLQEGVITRDLQVDGRLYDCLMMGRAV